MNGRYHIVSMKSDQGSLIAIEIAKRKKRESEEQKNRG